MFKYSDKNEYTKSTRATVQIIRIMKKRVYDNINYKPVPLRFIIFFNIRRPFFDPTNPAIISNEENISVKIKSIIHAFGLKFDEVVISPWGINMPRHVGGNDFFIDENGITAGDPTFILKSQS